VPEAALILIVDDERPIRELLTFVLQDAGYRTETAVNGAEALARIGERRPDLVISDLMMPVLGGADLCRRVKAVPASAALPFVLMSAVRHDGTAGADALLRKPFDLEVVEATVRRLLSAESTGAPTDAVTGLLPPI
jgi:sigma-B regulation protein RsbU (phosphoserine phosphatase)